MKPWTAEESDYLKEEWGKSSIPYISKKIGKSVNAVKLKAGRMGLGNHLHCRAEMTVNHLYQAIYGRSMDSYTMKIWKEHDFPIKYVKPYKKKRYQVIDLRDFWKWAERNRQIIDFSGMEPLALGVEPDWMKDKRRFDQLKSIRFKKTPWTQAEDDRLSALLSRYKYSYNEISRMMMRTEGAIKRRMLDLGLKQRPLRAGNHNPWTDGEVTILIGLYTSDVPFDLMPDSIPNRSVLAIKGKIERMIKSGELLSRVNKISC